MIMTESHITALVAALLLFGPTIICGLIMALVIWRKNR